MFPHAWGTQDWVPAVRAAVGTGVEGSRELPSASHSWVQPRLKPVWVTTTHQSSARQRIPQHPGSDIFQDDQQPLQTGDAQGTLLGRQMEGKTAVEMWGWRCTLGGRTSVSKRGHTAAHG